MLSTGETSASRSFRAESISRLSSPVAQVIGEVSVDAIDHADIHQERLHSLVEVVEYLLGKVCSHLAIVARDICQDLADVAPGANERAQ